MLALLLPAPATLLAQVRDGVDAVAVLGAAMLLAVSALVWALLGWGVVVLATAGASRLPGAGGRVARTLLRAMTPAIARRVLVVAAGVSVMAGAAACGTPDAAGVAGSSPVALTAPLAATPVVAGQTTGPVYQDGGYAGPGSSTVSPSGAMGPIRPAADMSTAGPTFAAAPAGSAAGTSSAVDGGPGAADSAGATGSDADGGPGPASASTVTAPPPTDPAAALLDLDWPTGPSTSPATGTATSPASDATTHPSRTVTTTPTPASHTATPSTTTAPAQTSARQTSAGPTMPPAPSPSASSAHPSATQPPATTTPAAPESTTASPIATSPAGTSTPPAGTTSPPPTSAPTADGPAPLRHAVTVRPGDSLWGIAARHLPAGASAGRIDAAWRQWYAANRSVIGGDPNLILPGQHLIAPTTEGSPS